MYAALDNPIWQALTTAQAHFAERDGDPTRFARAVCTDPAHLGQGHAARLTARRSAA